MKLVLSIFLVLSIVSTEAIYSYFSDDDCVISLLDTPSEGESESETQENAQDENKIEVLPDSFSNLDNSSLQKNIWNLFEFTSNGELKNITPPPEV